MIILHDTLLVTTLEESEEYMFAVVADTRQLFAIVRSTDDGLTETIQLETNGTLEDLDGAGGINRTVGGLTFIRQTQATIGEVAVLLKDLKSGVALADSSKSPGQAIRSSGMETRFYPAESKEDVEPLVTALTSFVLLVRGKPMVAKVSWSRSDQSCSFAKVQRSTKPLLILSENYSPLPPRP